MGSIYPQAVQLHKHSNGSSDLKQLEAFLLVAHDQGCICRDVKRAALARNWTVQTQSRPGPLLTRQITVFIGLRDGYEPIKNMNPLKLNRHRLLLC